MADYYPLVARAVAGLEKNTGEGRRMLYERARTALVAQLRGMNDPPLTEAEITRERLALEEAIRKVEAEAARRGREGPRPEPPKEPVKEPPKEPARVSDKSPDGVRDLDAIMARPPIPPTASSDRPPPAPPAQERTTERTTERPAERAVEPRGGPSARQGPMRAPSADDIDELPKRSRVGMVAALTTVLLILGLGATAYWQKDRIAALV